ncbi:MAG: histidine kinase dimerization/phospho-acceptor domain-containing protein [Lawsonella clevelandensis]
MEEDSQFVVIYCIDATEEARLEKTRRDFVANVSHELKTPVGAIALLAEALLTDVSDPAQVDYFANKLHTESMRLSQLIWSSWSSPPPGRGEASRSGSY